MMDDKTKYDLDYAKRHRKRVPLDLSLKDYEFVKAAALYSGESVNGFIKKSVAQRIQSDYEDYVRSKHTMASRGLRKLARSYNDKYDSKSIIIDMFNQSISDKGDA